MEDSKGRMAGRAPLRGEEGRRKKRREEEKGRGKKEEEVYHSEGMLVSKPAQVSLIPGPTFMYFCIFFLILYIPFQHLHVRGGRVVPAHQVREAPGAPAPPTIWWASSCPAAAAPATRSSDCHTDPCPPSCPPSPSYPPEEKVQKGSIKSY